MRGCAGMRELRISRRGTTTEGARGGVFLPAGRADPGGHAVAIGKRGRLSVDPNAASCRSGQATSALLSWDETATRMCRLTRRVWMNRRGEDGVSGCFKVID